jgi:hypothetical protein
MPLAVITDRGGERYELASCPDAFVVLRQMTYGEWQRRSDIVTRLTVETAERGGRNVPRRNADSVTRIDMRSLDVAIYEFKTCVVDHNLEDESGRKLDLGNVNDLQRLNPRIGSEIGRLIEQLNTWDEEEEENFTQRSNDTSSRKTLEGLNSQKGLNLP